MSASNPFSRITATAASVKGVKGNSRQFVDQRILLTGDREILATENGRQCFMDSLRLLVRMVRRLVVDVSAADSEFAEMVKALARGQAWDDIPAVEDAPIANLTDFDAILSVGSVGRPELPWTVVNSNGYAARVSSKGHDLPATCTRTNPIGALGAACFGAAEVFKRLIRLRPDVGSLHERLCFSFFSYRLEDDAGPEILGPMDIDLLLVGAGAIGNGIVHLVRAMPFSGSVKIVDNQAFDSENWGTCILLERPMVGSSKAKLLASLLGSKLEAKGYSETIEAFKCRCGHEINYPRLVLGALDNALARRELQDLWPNLIIDGAIGPTSCGVTLHPWGPDLSCLKCDFAEAENDATKTQQEATGLQPLRLADQDSLITEADVIAAPEARQTWLRSNIGRPICSVVSEAVLARIAERIHDGSFQPSVPFVACLSACMVVSELIRDASNAPAVLETGFQFSILVGPQQGMATAHARRRDCICVTKSGNIAKLRQRFGLCP